LRREQEAVTNGFVIKDTPAEQLAEAIRSVHPGRRVVYLTQAPEALSGDLKPLDHREREVLNECLEGQSVATVATRVHLSAGTVRNYLSSAIGKTGASNRVEAARTAQRNGWL